MSKEQKRQATLADFIAKKKQRDADRYKTEEIYVKSLDASLVFKKPSQNVLYDIIDEIDSGSTGSSVAGTCRLIYHCCDALQDPALHQELGIADPFDVVDALFAFEEIGVLGNRLTKFLGLDGTADSIKN